MRWLRIENAGELDRQGLLLMGASTKRNETDKRGMFGTGSKYAIATLVREGIPVEVHTTEMQSVGGGCMGYEDEQVGVRFRFTTQEVSLRGQGFQEVILLEGEERNGTPMHFTTELGLGWTVEMALRELVSNALDEPDASVQMVDLEALGNLSPKAGKTRVYVKLAPQVKQFWNDFDKLFLTRRSPVESGNGWALYPRVDGVARVYRKKVLVWSEKSKVAAFDYELDSVTVDEKRNADYWDLRWKMGTALKEATTNAKIQALRNIWSNPNALEADIHAEYFVSSEGNWVDALEGKLVVSAKTMQLLGEEMALVEDKVVMPEDWTQALERAGAKGAKDILSSDKLKGYRLVQLEDLSAAERSRLAQGMEFLVKAGIQVTPVEIFEAKDNFVLGEWIKKEDRILVNRTALGKTVREVVDVLLEEFVHRKSGAEDKTRAFQQALKAEWMELAQEKVGRYF